MISVLLPRDCESVSGRQCRRRCVPKLCCNPRFCHSSLPHDCLKALCNIPVCVAGDLSYLHTDQTTPSLAQTVSQLLFFFISKFGVLPAETVRVLSSRSTVSVHSLWSSALQTSPWTDRALLGKRPYGHGHTHTHHGRNRSTNPIWMPLTTKCAPTVH